MVRKLNLSTMFVIMFVLLFQPLSLVYGNEGQDPIKSIEELATKLIDHVKKQEYVEAKRNIENLAIIFPTIKYDSITTVEGIEAISSVIIQVKRDLSALQPNYKTLMFHSNQLYLSIDALSHTEQPLWQRYYNVIRNDVQQLKDVSDKEDDAHYQEALQHLQSHYLLIKPALFVSRSPSSIEKLDSLMIAFSSQGAGQNKDLLFKELQSTFEELFFGKNKETWGRAVGETVIWKTSLGMGTVIFLVLSYVTWRKFKGEQAF